MLPSTRLSGAVIALVALTIFGLPLGSAPRAAETSMRTQPNANDVGIWKSYVPHGLRGEFDSYDPIGLIAGALVRADCSKNWRDPDNGKLYCFSTGTSLNYFQDWPKSYSRRAAEAFERIQKERPGS